MNMDEMYRSMLRIRMVEEAIRDRYSEEKMRCPVHLSIGQEAIAVGVCAALPANSWIISNHRSHAHYLAKGGDLTKMIAELHGKATGCCGGRGGSMHLVDRDAGVLPSIPIVGGAAPIAVGAALALSEGVVACFLGDGAGEQGVFYEALNLAALKKAPVLFVIENNRVAVDTRLDYRQDVCSYEWRSLGFGLQYKRSGGDMLDNVFDSTHTLLNSLPAVLEVLTTRLCAHVGPGKPLNDWTVKEYKSIDPVEINRPEGWGDNGAHEFDAEIAAAFDAAEAAPWPQWEDE